MMDKKTSIKKQLTKILMEDSDDMYNKIRGAREMEERENNQGQIGNNVDDLMYLGMIDSSDVLGEINLDTKQYGENTVPFIWLNTEQEFVYYIDGKWQTSDQLNIVNVYADDEIKIEMNIKTDKVLVKPVKTGVAIDIDKKLPLILSKLSRYSVPAINAIIDCDLMGMNDLDEINDTLIVSYGIEDFKDNTNAINMIINEYDRWKKSLEMYNLVQTEQLDAINKAISQSFVDDLNEKDDLEVVDMAKLYNELVKERTEKTGTAATDEPEVEEEIVDDMYENESEEYWEDDERDLEFVEEETEEPELEGVMEGNPDEMTESEEKPNIDIFEDFDMDYSSFYPSPEEQIKSKASRMIKNINQNEVINHFEIYDPTTTYLTTDIDNDDTYLHVSKKYGSEIPSLFIKVGDEAILDAKSEQLNLYTIADSNAYIKMEDELEVDPVASFTDVDLISVLKVRIQALMDIEDETGAKIYGDNPALNNVLTKLMEAKMWLDLWSKTID